MGIFVSVIKKRAGSLQELITKKMTSRELESALNVSCYPPSVYFSDDGSAALVQFSTDTAIMPAAGAFYADVHEGGGCCALQGNVLLRNTDLVECDFLNAGEVYRMLNSTDYSGFRKKTEGDYSICVLRSDGSAMAFSDNLSIEHVYYAESAEYVILSNRIRLIRCFLANKPDLIALSGIVLIGSVLGDNTSVKGVRRLPQGSAAFVRNGVLRIVRHDADYFNDEEVSERCREDFQRFVRQELNVCTNKLAAALKSCKNASFALTGGKDSRSLLALIMKTPFAKDLNLFTSGYETHPDVVVAKMIAEHYGLKHEITSPTEPASDELTVAGFLEKMMGSVFQTDGMIGLFNARGYTDADPFQLALPGHVNEVFRGFRHKNLKIDCLTDCADYYKTINLYDPCGIMRPELHYIFDQLLTDRTNQYHLSGMNPGEITDTYFIGDRLPNWTGYLLRTDGYFRTQIQVMNNTNLIKAFWRKDCAEMREIELLHFYVMSGVDRWLAECPFAAQTWDRRLEKYAEGVNIRSEAIPLPKDLPMHGTWQHMLNSSPELKVKLLEIFMSYGSSEIWDLYDKDTVIRCFMSDRNSYAPMISLFGFINMFFFCHGVEIPMKVMAVQNEIKVPVTGDKGSAIYCYDNHKAAAFASWDEFVKSGLSNNSRIIVSESAIDLIKQDEAKASE